MSHYPIPFAPRMPDEAGRTIPARTRAFIMERDEGQCQYCGIHEQLGIDHIYPWANGGTHEPHNLTVACVVCNAIAGLRVFTEFAAKRDYVVQRRQQLGQEALDALYARASRGLLLRVG